MNENAIFSYASPLLVGGEEGEGEESFLSTPTLTLPHRKGEGIITKISNIFG